MLHAVMNPINPDPFDRLFDDIIPPIGFDFSLSRDNDMIVWKKALNTKIKFNNYKESYYEYVIVKLKIPKDASVVFAPWEEITGFSTPEKCSSYIDTLEQKLEDIKDLIEED